MISSQILGTKIKVPERCPNIVLLVGVGRSGTTAFLRVFAENGIPAWYQPIKEVLRRQMHGEDSTFTIPDDFKTVFIKETVGIYTQEESTFNPLEVLLNAGVPPDKISHISLLREPISSISSTIEFFSSDSFPQGGDRETLIRNKITSYKTIRDIRQEAENMGIRNVALVYEALRDNNPHLVVARLFDELQLPFTATSLDGWDNLFSLGSSESHITFPDEQELYVSTETHDYHQKVKHSTGLGYYPKEVSKIDNFLTVKDIQQLQDGGVFQIYEDMRRLCSHGLRLPINISNELTLFYQRHGILDFRDIIQEDRPELRYKEK